MFVSKKDVNVAVLKKLIPLVILLNCLLLWSSGKAQYLQFIENKGQWNSKVKYTGELNGGAFYLQNNGYKVLLNNADDSKRISDYYSAHKHDSGAGPIKRPPIVDTRKTAPGNSNTPDLTLHSHAYEATFIGANPSPETAPDKALETVNNYYIGNDSANWATGCRLYQAVLFKNMYPNIDVRYYTDNGQLKYDIIVHPGGDVSKVALRFDGTSGLSIKKGNLIIKTSVSDVTELAPLSYQPSATVRTNVQSSYVLQNNVVRFSIGNYDKSAVLVIDPQLIFSTFSGSRSDNWGYTATYDGAGNLFAGGIVFGNAYPVTIGAFQTTFAGGDNTEGSIGGMDVSISKFNPNGSVAIFATYLGGSGNEQPHSLVTDKNGNLIIAGRTSNASFPTTVDVFGPGGGFDIFLTKLSANGALLASRRIGGTKNDGVNIEPKYASSDGVKSIRQNYGDDARTEVNVDDATNIYLASCTQSTDLLMTDNAFQKGSAGAQDGVVIKASPDLRTIYLCSYLGGGGNDATFVLALNPSNNNIYVAGATGSGSNGEALVQGITNTGTLPKTFQGGVADGFVSLISGTTFQLIKTAYFGSKGDDLIYGIQFDKFGYPYIMGTTTGSIPLKNTAFNSQPTGKQFITKLQPDLNDIVYSTNFGRGGSGPDISPIAFLVDRCENVYVSGWGGGLNKRFHAAQSTTGLTVTGTPTPIKGRTDGSDFYFFVLKRDATAQLYGSFFGQDNGAVGDHVDGGTSRFDKQGVIYQAICANCEADVRFPTSFGVAYPYNSSASGDKCSLAAIKIAFELAGIGNGVRASIEGRAYDTTGCVPLTVSFVDTLALGKLFKWSFGDGSPDTTTLIANVTHTYNNIGNYRVRLISIDSTTCNVSDTSFTTIHARKDKAILDFTSVKLPPCTSLSYQFNNTSTPPAGKPFSGRSFVWDFGDGSFDSTTFNPVHAYAAQGTYIVKLMLIDSNYCNAPDEIVDTLRIAANVKALFETPPAGCAPYDAVFNNTSLAGESFTWDFGDGTSSTEEYPTHHYENPGSYTVTLTAVDTSTCNKQDVSAPFTIIVSSKPVAGFTFSPIPPQNNVPTTFLNGSTGATNYKWTFGDGDELLNIRRDSLIQHIYNRTDTFVVQLVAYNQYGCTDTATHTVSSLITPLVDVPNAIAPTGTNRYISVKGFGIVKMDWRIYNRWGKMIFYSTSLKTPWDGTYNGVLQPMEVYTYTLNVEFSDGQKAQKTGDITLLR